MFIFSLWDEKIPVRFYRTFEGVPFANCDCCASDLMEDNRRHIIIKFYEGRRVIQEMVLCDTCIIEFRKGMSEESKAKLVTCFDQKKLAAWRDPIIIRGSRKKVELLTAKCAICEIPRRKMKRHIEYALCEKSQILLRTLFPYSICEDCLTKVYDSLSKKTREHEDDFWRRFLGLPPDFKTKRPEDVENFRKLLF